MAEQESVDDADYVCTLDEASLHKARQELYEDPNNRLGAVSTFREWILQQKHINSPTDTDFLLRFLRARKFSQLESRKLLENYLARRQKLKRWFLELDPSAEGVQDIIGSGMFLILPGTDRDGRKVFMFRFGALDLKRKDKKEQILRTGACLLEWMLLDENNQVNGIVEVVDYTGMTLKHQTFFSMEETRSFFQMWQKNFPMRVKSINMYNCGLFIEYSVALVKFAMSEKMQKRISTHNSLDSLYKTVPMEMWPEEFLPDEYDGPSAGTIEDVTDGMKKDFANPQFVARLKYLTQKEFTADLSQRPDDVPQASFMKLNVD